MTRESPFRERGPGSPHKAWSPLLAYSTNVHGGKRVADIYRYLSRHTIPVKERLRGAANLGLELHLGTKTAKELLDAGSRDKFKGFLRDHGLFVFSINAFPLRDFHARRVKERVYEPSWLERERVDSTVAVATVLADLLPRGIVGSVSTMAGAFRHRPHGPAVLDAMARNYGKVIEALERLEAGTGKTIVLAVEPEPDTTLETAREVIDFFEGNLLPAAQLAWGRRGVSRSRAERSLRKHFTVNFDACHFSVLFQGLVRSLRELSSAGIQVGKLHVTSALSLRDPHRFPEAYAELRAMREPRYLHQFCGRDVRGGIRWRGLDLDHLPRRLSPSCHPQVVEIRSHYHVPVCSTKCGALETTRSETEEVLREVARTGATSHLVVETYTWPLLEAEDRLAEGIARELRWLVDVLGRSR